MTMQGLAGTLFSITKTAMKVGHTRLGVKLTIQTGHFL